VDAVGHPRNNCTAPRVIAREELDRIDAEGGVHWHDGVTVLVPSYAWVFNIYHYGRQLNAVAHVVAHLRRYLGEARWAALGASEGGGGGGRVRRGRRRPVRVMFRLQGHYPDAWHVHMTALFFRHVLRRAAGPGVDVQPEPAYLFEKPGRRLVCLRDAVVLGAEGGTDAMQFLNDTDVRSSPPDIPHAAIAFKEAVYAGLNLSGAGFARAVGGAGGDGDGGAYAAIPVPSTTVAYAAREAGSPRHFPGADEAWFRALLVRETAARGLRLVRLSAPANRSLADQVRAVRDVGLLVGIHGANLANSMFMRPGGAVFEVFPHKYVKLFYRNGGNSGLRYSSHEVETSVDRDCSAFHSAFCQVLYRDVVVNLTAADRSAIARHLRDGMDYIVQLRAAHPGGMVPIRRDPATAGPYHMDGFSFPPSPTAVDQFPFTFGERWDTAGANGTGEAYRPRSTTRR
jgi:hypothetical protein